MYYFLRTPYFYIIDYSIDFERDWLRFVLSDDFMNVGMPTRI